MAASRQDGADGTNFADDEYSENVADQYQSELLSPWIDSSGPHWQQPSGYLANISADVCGVVAKQAKWQKKCKNNKNKKPS